jgi:hypothetical protein
MAIRWPSAEGAEWLGEVKDQRRRGIGVFYPQVRPRDSYHFGQNPILFLTKKRVLGKILSLRISPKFIFGIKIFRELDGCKGGPLSTPILYDCLVFTIAPERRLSSLTKTTQWTKLN